MQEIFALALVFGLIAVAGYLLRTRSNLALWPRTLLPESDNNGMRQLNRLPLTPQHCLHAVKVQGQEVFLVTHPAGCTVIPLEMRDGR